MVVVNDLRTEGSDVASLALPGDQNELIAAVAAANPRTIVVLHTSGAVLMPWLAGRRGSPRRLVPRRDERTCTWPTCCLVTCSPSGRLPYDVPRRR